MGGIGSGNWYRWDTRTTTEEVPQVDIRFLKKKGMLEPGTHGNLSWNCGGESTGNISFEITHDGIYLKYKYRRFDEEWKHKNEHITFDWTHCNYGGSRQWLVCPHCGNRVAIIYGLDSGFLCRHCYELPYSSQSEGHIDRMMRKARKIRKRIENEGGFFEKPKGMHWKTYNMLVTQESGISLYADKAIELLFSNY